MRNLLSKWKEVEIQKEFQVYDGDTKLTRNGDTLTLSKSDAGWVNSKGEVVEMVRKSKIFEGPRPSKTENLFKEDPVKKAINEANQKIEEYQYELEDLDKKLGGSIDQWLSRRRPDFLIGEEEQFIIDGANKYFDRDSDRFKDSDGNYSAEKYEKAIREKVEEKQDFLKEIEETKILTEGWPLNFPNTLRKQVGNGHRKIYVDSRPPTSYYISSSIFEGLLTHAEEV